MPRYSLRKNGEVMTTVRLEHHVGQKLIQQIATRCSISEDAALQRIRKILNSDAEDALCWRVFAIDPEGSLTTIHTDDVKLCQKDGYQCFTE